MVKQALLSIGMILCCLTQVSEAQLFGRLFNREAQSCAGSRLFTGRVVSNIANRRASRIQSRTQSAGCGGIASQSNSLSYSQVEPTSGCGGTVSYQEYVPSVVNYSEPTVPALQAAPICVGGQCTVNQAAPIKSTAPVKSFMNAPKTIPATNDLFGLSVANDSYPNHILAQIATETTFGLETTIPEYVLGQFTSDPVPPPIATAPIKTARDSFRMNLLKAVVEARKSGKISARDAVRIRVASLSPAFVERAHELAITQMAFSGETSEFVPMNEEGMIQVEGINWDGLIKFLEAFIPLLLTLLKAFGM